MEGLTGVEGRGGLVNTVYDNDHAADVQRVLVIPQGLIEFIELDMDTSSIVYISIARRYWTWPMLCRMGIKMGCTWCSMSCKEAIMSCVRERMTVLHWSMLRARL